MTIGRDCHPRRQRMSRLADSIEDNRSSPLRWIFVVGRVLLPALGAAYWLLRGH